jgi:hypothetical protein
VSSGDGEEVINSRFLERLSVGRRHPCSVAQEKSLENSSLRRKRADFCRGKILFYFLLEFSVDDGYQTEGREFFAGLQPFNEKRTFGGGPAVDVLALEIFFHRECFEVSESFVEKEMGRDLDFITDKQVKRGRKLLGFGHCDHYFSFYFLFLVVMNDSFDLDEEGRAVLSARGRFVELAVKIDIFRVLEFEQGIGFIAFIGEGMEAGA